MNWKFWQNFGCQACELNRLALRNTNLELAARAEQIKRLEAAFASRTEEIVRLRRLLAFKQRPASEQPTEAQIFSALVMVDESNPLWRAFHRFLDLHEAQEQAELGMRGLSNEDRQYLAGRASKVEDLRTNLLKIWHDAITKNHEAQ